MMIWQRFLVTFLCGLLSCAVNAQLRQIQPQGAELLASLKKLNVLGSVLYFAAHPDDENTRLIAWSAKEKHYKTAYLALTRGDGGQNLIGTELAEELGLIRTQELLAARQVDGGEQFFSRANDFGFSKTPNETLEFWGEQAILADAVWVIRNVKPDVIITRFPPDPRAGHGHHQAATILAIEAFEAAADSTRFPEQLAYVSTWQAKRLMWNAANFGGQNSTTSSQFQVDIGSYNPLIGQSYGELAAESRSKHKSQGFGAARQRGSSVEFFESLAGDQPKYDLMDGVETTWTRVKGAAGISDLITQLVAQFDISYPEKSIPQLIQLLDRLEELEPSYWREIKIEEVKDLILSCGGIWFESYAALPKVALSEQVEIRTDFIRRRPGVEVEIQMLEIDQDKRLVGKKLADNQILAVNNSFQTKASTQPYWLRKPLIQSRFDVSNQLEIGSPENIDHPKVQISLKINGKLMRFERPVVFKYTDPVQGEVYQALVVAPPVTAALKESALVFSGKAEKNIDVVFTSHQAGNQKIEVVPEIPSGWRISPEKVEVVFKERNEEVTLSFKLSPPEASSPSNAKSHLRFLLSPSGQEQKQSEPIYAQNIRAIAYPHIPLITYFPLSSTKLTQLETGVSSKKIGYIVGAGDLVPEALRQIGLSVDLLTEKDVVEGNLSQYDAIVSGIRIYNVNDRMPFMYAKLMQYIEQGGTYLMQYNVSSGLSTVDFGPFPFKLSRLRVTDEQAEVTFKLPNSKALNYPNKITAVDFESWIQERGLYFAIDADPRLEAPLSMHDSGEPAQEGSLLIGQYGKGKFVFTSLAFFRQLPAGVPGAYRLFINLLAKEEK